MKLPRRLVAALVGSATVAAGVAALPGTAHAAGPAGPDSCLYGYVWRDTAPWDHVCVEPSSRDQAWFDNGEAWARVEPGQGDWCRAGFVWREAWDGDHVCVTPDVRDRTWDENARAANRRALDHWSYDWGPVQLGVRGNGFVEGLMVIHLEPSGGYVFHGRMRNTATTARMAGFSCQMRLRDGSTVSWEVLGYMAGGIGGHVGRDQTAEWYSAGSHPWIAEHWTAVDWSAPDCSFGGSDDFPDRDADFGIYADGTAAPR
jgi:hypothetical protein